MIRRIYYLTMDHKQASGFWNVSRNQHSHFHLIIIKNSYQSPNEEFSRKFLIVLFFHLTFSLIFSLLANCLCFFILPPSRWNVFIGFSFNIINYSINSRAREFEEKREQANERKFFTPFWGKLI